VTEMIWYRHAELDAVTEQPASAQSILAASGWFPLPDKDVAARAQEAADASAAADAAMREQAEESAARAEAALVVEPPPPPEPPPVSRDERKTKKGTD